MGAIRVLGVSCLAAIVLFGAVSDSYAQDPATPEEAGVPAETRKLNFKTGKITIGRDEVIVDTPPSFAYLESADARYIVEDVWGNPPDPSILGLFCAGGESGLMAGNYAVIVSMDRDGFTDDSDAAEMDFDDLLSTMQDDTSSANEVRKERGYPTVDLVGWAEPPHYDSGAKKLYWAKRLRFEGAEGDTLNYDVRVLGRKGKLVYSAVAGVEELAAVAEGCKQLLAATEFTDGNRYQDFDSNIDKVAAGGIGALIAGKVLMKAGFFALIAKFWKVIVLAIVGIGALVKKMRGRSQPT